MTRPPEFGNDGGTLATKMVNREAYNGQFGGVMLYGTTATIVGNDASMVDMQLQKEWGRDWKGVQKL